MMDMEELKMEMKVEVTPMKRLGERGQRNEWWRRGRRGTWNVTDYA